MQDNRPMDTLGLRSIKRTKENVTYSMRESGRQETREGEGALETGCSKGDMSVIIMDIFLVLERMNVSALYKSFSFLPSVRFPRLLYLYCTP